MTKLGRHEDDDLAFARHIISFPVFVFIEDTKDLVVSKVQPEIKLLLKTGNTTEKSWAKIRHHALKGWLESKTPLIWCNEDHLSENYAHIGIITTKDNPCADNQESYAQLKPRCHIMNLLRDVSKCLLLPVPPHRMDSSSKSFYSLSI